ncbi:MAG TPA: response regulator [Azospirillaceae bacterium]|nr:response regulator [Azospirillaceae bacterium]
MATVLLVEDEIDLRDNIEIVLAHAGHEVLTAGDGREALAVIESSPPDVVVSDISMPVMTGLQLLARVRQTMPGLADMPFIFLTALGDKEHVIDGREAGVDDYLTKPVDFQVLTATIAARLARARQAKDLKDRQFVKLFKGLTHKPTEMASGEPAGEPAADRIAALAEPSLRGRAQLLHPEEFMPDFARLAPTARDKALIVLRRIVDGWLSADDVCVALGGGSLLIVQAAADRAAAVDRFTFLRMRLAQALGVRRAGAALGDDDEADDGGAGFDGGDAELKDALRALYADAMREGRIAPDPAIAFDVVANQFRIVYEPVLDVRMKAATAFHVGWRRDMGGLALAGAAALLSGGDDAMMSDLTCLAFDQGICDVMALRGRPEQGRDARIMILPVPLQVFQGMEAYKIERQIDDMARLLDRATVGFHVWTGDEDVPVGLLRKIFATLSRAGEWLIADLNPNQSRPERLLALGCRTLRVDANAVLAAGYEDDAMRGVLTGAVRQAARPGYDVWAAGVDSSALARQLIGAGVAFLSGKAAGEPKAAPDHFA